MGIFGVLKNILVGGPLVGELIKLDKEAQRDVARGLKYALILVGAGVASVLLLVVAALAKLIF